MANLDTDTSVNPSLSHDGFTNTPRMDFDRAFENSSNPQGADPQTFYRKGLDQGRRLVSGVRSHVDANPWLDLGIIAAACLAVGYFMGTRSRVSPSSSYRIGVGGADVDTTDSEDLTLGRSY